MVCLVSCIHKETSTHKEYQLTATEKETMFDELVAQLERLDAQALAVRANSKRTLSWPSTISELRKSFLNAQSSKQYQDVFEKLNLAYTNGHAELHLGPTLTTDKNNQIASAIVFETFWISENTFKNQIIWIDAAAFPKDAKIPNIGDEVIAINGVEITKWYEENFNFCKWPLKNQCNSIFATQLQTGKLSWRAGEKLSYKIRRSEESFSVDVPPSNSQENPLLKSPKRQRIETTEKIKREYPGFKLVYTGENAFVYESKKNPKLAVLRITSFGYWPNSPVKTPFEEVENLSHWWKGSYDHLILDLTENRGGNDPMPYFKILFHRPVENVTRVRFKKINEFFSPNLQESLFWDDPQRLAFIGQLKTHWDDFHEGDLLPTEPFVCGRPVGFDCAQKYLPYKHSFNGRISVLISKKCMSSCDEFVLTLKNSFGNRMRLIGQPEYSDTGFSRLKIEVLKSPIDGHWTRILPYDAPISSDTFFQQEAVVTRSVDDKGDIIDGKPLKLDVFVPYTIENLNSWHQDVVKAALKK